MYFLQVSIELVYTLLYKYTRIVSRILKRIRGKHEFQRKRWKRRR